MRTASTPAGKRTLGTVVEREWKGGRGYALRFRAYGDRHYVTLGSEHDGWTYDVAEEELSNILADVRRGIWVPPRKQKKGNARDAKGGGVDEEVTFFGPFARKLVEGRKDQVSERQHEHERWGLGHLLPYFGDWPIVEIDVEAVDNFRSHKVKESESRQRAIERRHPLRNKFGNTLRPLSPSTINKMIGALRWVLEVAREYGLIAENPAVGKKRRLKVPPKRPVHLDSVHQIEALLEAAAQLDREPQFILSERRPIVSTFVLAGPRAMEAGHMVWRDVDLANGRLLVGRSKTSAGLREIRLLPVLRDDLTAYKALADRSGPDDLVFPTSRGRPRTKDTFLKHVLKQVFERADALLRTRGQTPLPKGLTTHKLRHTFASVMVACGEDPASVMRQLGHSDPHFTLRVYTHMMSRDTGERARLKALVREERVIAVQAPPTEPLRSTDYEEPILLALDARGGAARRQEIMAAVGEAMADRHGSIDFEALPSCNGYTARWKSRFGKARKGLIARGWMKEGSRRGVWELTPLGTAKALKVGSQRSEPSA